MNPLQLEHTQDFYSWIYKNIDLLKQRKFADLDKETALPMTIFPLECPYSIEQLFDEDFYPKLKINS